jgi:hypothetical protein
VALNGLPFKRSFIDLLELEMRQSVQSLNHARTQAQDDARDLNIFNYGGIAELYSSRDRKSGRPSGYKRFESAAEAIRYFMEELPASSYPGAYLEIDDARFIHRDIQRLYESPNYPLARPVSA